LAQFRTTADIMDLALSNAGEVTNGNSSYETDLLNKLNRVHHTLVTGGTISLGKDTTVTIDETWPWARARKPLIIELQPKYDTGTLTLTQGSATASMSTPPAYSLLGWYVQVQGKSEWYRITGHTASDSALSLDGGYADEDETAASFIAVKLDYSLVTDYIVVDTTNNKLQWQEVAGTTITATITSAAYTPAQLATEIQTAMGVGGGTPVYTVTYDTVSRKFTIASDRGGGAVFVLVGTGSSYSIHKTLGFDDENSTNAASITSTYALSEVARLIEPLRIHKANEGSIYGIDPESFQRHYPFTCIEEGNPDTFTVLRESTEGLLTARFNRYPSEKTRIEVEHVPVPRDLKDSSASIPLIPRKHADVLEDAATFFIMLLKHDDRAVVYQNLVQGKLQAMIAQHRGAMVRSGNEFGQIMSRRDNSKTSRRRLFPDDPY
jgi:hypothetical protein